MKPWWMAVGSSRHTRRSRAKQSGSSPRQIVQPRRFFYPRSIRSGEASSPTPQDTPQELRWIPYPPAFSPHPGCCPFMKLCTKPVRSENKTPAGFRMVYANDICRRVSRQIAGALKSGSIPWRKDWVGDRNSGMPCNLDGTSYREMNALLLQMAAAEFGYRS